MSKCSPSSASASSRASTSASSVTSSADRRRRAWNAARETTHATSSDTATTPTSCWTTSRRGWHTPPSSMPLSRSPKRAANESLGSLGRRLRRHDSADHGAADRERAGYHSRRSAVLRGTAVTRHRAPAKALGYLLHLAAGAVFALPYHAIFAAADTSGWFLGAVLRTPPRNRLRHRPRQLTARSSILASEARSARPTAARCSSPRAC
jgi:hypothetical protein